MNWKQLKELADKKASFLDNEPDEFMNEVYRAEERWYKMVTGLTDGFDVEDDHIISSKKNVRVIGEIDGLYNTFLSLAIYPLIINLITRLQDTIEKNTEYYKTMLQFSYDVEAAGIRSMENFNTALKAGEIKLSGFASTEANVFSIINSRLGIDSKGQLVKGGFIYNLYNNPALLDNTRELLYNGVISEMPVKAFKQSLSESIVSLRRELPGEEGKTTQNGELAKLYAPISNDIFAKVDRTATSIIQQDNELKYFIYAGTIVKKTRPFCREKVNKIFSTEEAKQWPNEEPGPIYIDKATYNAVIDMGGINCRHTPMFISNELYTVLKDEGSDLIPI